MNFFVGNMYCKRTRFPPLKVIIHPLNMAVYPLNVAVYPVNTTQVRLLDGQRFDVGFTIGLAQPRTLTSF